MKKQRSRNHPRAKQHVAALLALVPEAQLNPRIHGPLVNLIALTHTPPSFHGHKPRSLFTPTQVRHHYWKVHVRALLTAALPQFEALDDWLAAGNTQKPLRPPALTWDKNRNTYLFDGESPLQIPEAAARLLTTYLDQTHPTRPPVVRKHDYPVTYQNGQVPPPEPVTYAPVPFTLGCHVALVLDAQGKCHGIHSTHPVIVKTVPLGNNPGPAFTFSSNVRLPTHNLTNKGE